MFFEFSGFGCHYPKHVVYNTINNVIVLNIYASLAIHLPGSNLCHYWG